MSDARASGRASLSAPRASGRGLPPGFGVLWTTVAVDLLGFGIVVPLLPLYAHRLGAGPGSVGLLLAAFSAAQFVERAPARPVVGPGGAQAPAHPLAGGNRGGQPADRGGRVAVVADGGARPRRGVGGERQRGAGVGHRPRRARGPHAGVRAPGRGVRSRFRDRARNRSPGRAGRRASPVLRCGRGRGRQRRRGDEASSGDAARRGNCEPEHGGRAGGRFDAERPREDRCHGDRDGVAHRVVQRVRGDVRVVRSASSGLRPGIDRGGLRADRGGGRARAGIRGPSARGEGRRLPPAFGSDWRPKRSGSDCSPRCTPAPISSSRFCC